MKNKQNKFTYKNFSLVLVMENGDTFNLVLNDIIEEYFKIETDKRLTEDEIITDYIYNNDYINDCLEDAYYDTINAYYKKDQFVNHWDIIKVNYILEYN